MADQLLTVSVFVSAAEAEAARDRLQAEGIEAQTIPQEQSSGAARIAVQVGETDFQRAMSVLFPVPKSQTRAAPSRTVELPPGWTCSGCGAEVMGISDTCWSCGRPRAEPGAGEPSAVEPAAMEHEQPPSDVASLPAGPLDAAASPAVGAASAAPDANAASAAPSPTVEAVASARRPRFAVAPPPWAAAPAGLPAPEPAGQPAVPRFAKLRSVVESDAATGEATETNEPSAAETQPAPAAEPPPPAEPAEASSQSTAAIEPDVVEIPLFVEPHTARRRDRQQESLAREAESMALRAWWASVIGLALWPAYLYSVWLLLTLTFARVSLSRRGRWCFWGGWIVSAVAVMAIFLFVKSRE